ncbi:MAG: hypothetical protein IJG87_03145 [Ruminococcus sp.]|nr:hypothetical protein [Ruminococcus sp.]
MFQLSVKKLSDSVGQASSLWKDDKFSQLSLSVSQVANQAKRVMVTGERVCTSLDKFDSIASETY